MGLCRDKSVTYLQKFGFNVVRLPSADIAPLQLIGEYRGSIGIIGSLADLVTAEDGVPSIETGIEAPQISGQQSSKMPLALSAAILDGIAERMGAKGKASTAYRHAHALRFEFNNVKRDRVGIAEVGRYLAGHEVAWEGPVIPRFLFGPGKLFLIREVLKSKSFSVSAFNKDGAEASIEVSLPGDTGSAGVNASRTARATNTIKYDGDKDLVFGFIADQIFLQDHPVTGMLCLGFEPVRAGQVALGPGSPAVGRVAGPTLAFDVLDELRFTSLEELIAQGGHL